jgi:hypothetical protein
LFASALAAAPGEPEHRTRYFEFYFRGTRPSAHAPLLAGADAVADRVAADLGIPWPARTRVIVAGSLGDFRAALPGGVELGGHVAGVAFVRENLIVLCNVPEIREVFAHESSHIALLTAARGRRLPRWFVEGFAAHQSGEGSFGRLTSLVRASVSGTLIPLRDLERSFPERHDIADLAYAQSAELVSYLLGAYGRRPFRVLLEALASGEEFFAALTRAYRRSIGEIEEEYLKDLQVRFNWVPIVTGSLTLWAAVTLLFLLAAWRKRRATRRRLEEMAREEAREDAEEDGTTLPPPTLH